MRPTRVFGLGFRLFVLVRDGDRLCYRVYDSLGPPIRAWANMILFLHPIARIMVCGRLKGLDFTGLCLLAWLGCTDNTASGGYIEPELGIIMWSFRILLAIFSYHELCGVVL
jgi:hypothetical protein